MAKKRRSRKWFWFILIAVILGAGGAIAAGIAGRGPKPIEITTEKSELRTITSIVTATGKIYPKVEVKISSETAGEIIELPVVEGQNVKKGDLLVRIKPDIYEARVLQQEATVAAARVRSLQAKAEMLKAELDLRRAQDLQAKGFAAQAEVDAASTQLEITQANYQASLYQIQQQETQLAQAREDLSKTVIYAPMDGTISSLSAELGERVVGTGQFAGTEIMRVADLSKMEVRIQVAENDIVNVKLHDRTKIEIDALPGRIFWGTVEEIASSAYVAGEQANRSAVSQQQEITTFEVRIRIADLDPNIKPGMTATADIETATVENVVSVPLQSVTVRDRAQLENQDSEKQDPSHQKKKQKKDAPPEEGRRPPGGSAKKARDNLVRLVFVKEGDKVKIRTVTTGISDNTHIEIKEGLKVGEEIVSGPYTAISRELKNDSVIKLKEKDGKNAKKWGYQQRPS